MNDIREYKVLKVVKIAIKFIEKLDENQLDSLINKESNIYIKDKNIKLKKNKCKEQDNHINFEDIITSVNKMNDRIEATAYIRSLAFTKGKLISLGDELGIKISKNIRKDKMVDIIVEATVGSKLKINGLERGIRG